MFASLSLMAYLRIALGIAIAIAIGFIGYKIYSFGYQRAEIVYTLQIEKYKDAAATETARQTEVNAQVLKEASVQLSKLQSENDELNDQVDDTISAADKDPNASRVCLGSASVQRLNAIGSHSSRKASTASSAQHSKMF